MWGPTYPPRHACLSLYRATIKPYVYEWVDGYQYHRKCVGEWVDKINVRVRVGGWVPIPPHI